MIAKADDIRALAQFYSSYGWFLALWAASLTIVCASAAVVLRPDHAHDWPEPGRRWRETIPTKAAIVAVGALAIFACAYAFLIFSGEDLVGIDYAQLTASRFVAMPIWPSTGRFFPLGLQEYNVLALIGKSATVFHALSIVQLGAAIVCVFRLLDEQPAWLRCTVIVVMMTMPSFVEAFFGLVIPERDIVFWLLLWIVCLQTFARTGSRRALFAALIVAQFILYYKETAFVLIGGFAGARLISSMWNSGEPPWRRRLAHFLEGHVLELGHLTLCFVFLAIYVGYIVPRVTASYVSVKAASASVVALKAYARSDLLFDALVIAFGARLISFFTSKRRPDVLWDPLAAGALAYGFAYIKLGMTRDYYLAPADCIAALYVGRQAYAMLRAQRRWAIACVVVAVAWAVRRDVGDAAFEILSRKGFVAAHVNLASFLKDAARANTPTNVSLYFPEVDGFDAMEFSAYLQYKGMRTSTAENPPSGDESSFTVATPHRYSDDRCYPSQSFLCLYEPVPRAGEMVVFLPGRPPSTSQLQELRAHATMLFRFHSGHSNVERILHALLPADRDVDPVDAYVFQYSTTVSARRLVSEVRRGET